MDFLSEMYLICCSELYHVCEYATDELQKPCKWHALTITAFVFIYSVQTH